MSFTPRSHHDWHLRTRTLVLGPRTIVMGILNVTPDSFSDGGLFYSPEHAPERGLAQAIKMLDEGADILDIGGESTRPNATPLTADEEQSRILPVIATILKAKPATILSVDTFHAATARAAIEAGSGDRQRRQRPPLGPRDVQHLHATRLRNNPHAHSRPPSGLASPPTARS